MVNHINQDFDVHLLVAVNHETTELNRVAAGSVIGQDTKLNATFHGIPAGGGWGLIVKGKQSLANVNHNLHQHLQVALHWPPRPPIILQITGGDNARERSSVRACSSDWRF